MPTRPNIDVFERLKASAPTGWSGWSTVHSPGSWKPAGFRKPPHRLISFRIICSCSPLLPLEISSA